LQYFTADRWSDPEISGVIIMACRQAARTLARKPSTALRSMPD
jgi:hypothetical protein